MEGLCHIVCFGAYGGSRMLDALRIVNGLFLTLVANLCNAWEISEKCSRNFFFFFFNSSSSRLMKAIRLIPNIHVLKQQI